MKGIQQRISKNGGQEMKTNHTGLKGQNGQKSKRSLSASLGAIGLVLLSSQACSKLADEGVQQALNEQNNAGAIVPRFSLCVYNAVGAQADGAAIYCDKNAGTSLQMIAGKSYVFQITSESDGGPYVYRTQLQRVDLLSSIPSAPLDLNAGANLFTAPSAGDYAIRIAVVDGGTVFPARTFQTAIACNNPTPLSVGGLNLAGINVSGGANVFSFSSAGVVSGGVGGQAPYICAWDYNGDGTRDSAYADCSVARNNVYVNHHGTRLVGILVKDSCNTTVSATVSRSLMPAPTRTPGDASVFIHGVVSNATGAAASHRGVNNVNYWGINNQTVAGRTVVTSVLQPNGANSTFAMASAYSYGQPSSVEFGQRISLSGLNVQLGANLASTSISAASAVMSNIQFNTDQSGDNQLPLQLAGTTCTLTDQGARVLEVLGTPCAAGQSNATWGQAMRWTFHVWGRYECTNVSASGASATITGEFDGLDDVNDGCVGGGQGQGGNPPPQF